MLLSLMSMTMVFTSTNWIFQDLQRAKRLLYIAIGTSFSLFIVSFFFRRKMSTSIGFALFIVVPWTLSLSFLASSSISIYLTLNQNNVLKSLAIIAIPGATLIVIGLLSWFNIFKFWKLYSFLIFGTFGLIIFSIVSFFIFNSVLHTIYSVLAYIIFSLWIGFDIWIIQKKAEYIQTYEREITISAFLALALTSAFSIFIDVVNLVLITADLLR
ncbi:Bax inhibitor-1/YccA family protein [Mycoplasmopsis pulmonis]|nr:Bax inhibitor-1 family protein [Mycoplasmopsis pulmonis]MDZ7293190.1 Bax inhibitor-1 family protein [Mycoplasmopsis pulmonis]